MYPQPASELGPQTAPLSSTTQHHQADPRVVLRFPQINRTAWYRLACLAHARGEHPDALQEFLQHCTYECEARGSVRDVPRLIATFAEAQGISPRSAWRALKAATARGWLRCVQHAAPGYRARYQLQVPTDLIVSFLPEDLEVALRLWDEDELPDPDHADSYFGHLSEAPLAPVSLEVAAPFPAPPTDPDATPDPANHTGTSTCHTSPYTAKVSSPLWGEDVHHPGGIESSDAPTRPGKPRPDEVQAALQVLVRCERWWIHQRGPRCGVLSAAQRRGLVEPVAYALRRSTPTELIEVLTVQTRSARSLVNLVGFRAWRLVKTRVEYDQAVTPPGDEEGLAHAELLARQHAHHPSLLAGRARVRAAVQAAKDAKASAGQDAAARTVLTASQRPDADQREAEFQAWQVENPPLEDADPLTIYRARATQARHDQWRRDWNR